MRVPYRMRMQISAKSSYRMPTTIPGWLLYSTRTRLDIINKQESLSISGLADPIILLITDIIDR